MRCPYCGSDRTKVINSESKHGKWHRFSRAYDKLFANEPDYRLRRIRCNDCYEMFTTVELYTQKE